MKNNNKNVEKAQGVAVMKPKFDTNFLYNLHGQYFEFHSQIRFF